MSRLSARLPPRLETNAISDAIADARRRGIDFIDLTESNPTRVNLPYPQDILAGLADPRALAYDPHPFGLRSAREAIAADHGRRGVSVNPDDVVLSASTSESYTWLFKLLCNPGDSVLVPTPSYPLFEHLTRLEAVASVPYRVDFHGRWEIDFASVEAAPDSTRAVIVVSPNNPTGSFVSAGDFDQLLAICARRGWAVIADEVFADYPLDAHQPFTDLATRATVLSFTLGGASKALGLPQVKLGWIVAGGPRQERARALAALEHIADTFLSVSTPVQVAAPGLLARGSLLRGSIHARVRANLERARAIAAGYPSCQLLPVEGGWCAVVRVPRRHPEETVVLDLLAHEQVLVHPGYFFDFPYESFLIVSLLPDEQRFADALARTLHFVH